MVALPYFLSLSGVGIPISGFIFGPLALYILWLVGRHLILLRPFRDDTFVFFLLLITVSFASTAFRHSVSTYLPSLMVFSALSAILLIAHIEVKPDDIKRLKKSIVLSFYLVVGYCAVEFVLSNLGGALWSLWERAIFLNGSANSYFGVVRIRGLTTEPSNLAKLFVFYFLIFHFFFPRVFNETKYHLSALCLIGLLFTMSTTGFAGIIMLWSAYAVFSMPKWPFVGIGTFLLSCLTLIGALLTLLCLAYFFPEYSSKMLERFTAIKEVLVNRNFEGSVGFRVASLLAVLEFFKFAGLFDILFGLGFSNFDGYLIDNYAHLERSGLSEGLPGNLFTAVFLSTGVLGAIALALFLVTTMARDLSMLSLLNVVFVVFIFASSGNLTSPYMWAMFSLLAYFSSSWKRMGHDR